MYKPEVLMSGEEGINQHEVRAGLLVTEYVVPPKFS